MTSAQTVCRVAEVVRPAAGGIRRHVSELLEHLDRDRFVPTLFAPDDFQPDRPLPNLIRHAVPIGATTHPLRDYRAALQLAQLLRGKIDIVHAHGLRGAVVGGFAARLAHLPYLLTIHNLLPPLNPLQATVFRALAGKAACIISVSSAVELTLEKNGVTSSRRRVVPNGVGLPQATLDSLQARADLGIASDVPVVLGLGRLSPEKGFDLLIAAFAELLPRRSDAVLLLAGDGPEAARLKAQAAPLGDRVRFCGYASDTAHLFAAADLVVAPSRQEGQGIVPMEAMAAYRAVVAGKVGGLVETVEDGVTGLLVPTENAHALSIAIENLLTDTGRREAMALAGRRRVEEEYTLEKQIQRTEAIYNDVFRSTA